MNFAYCVVVVSLLTFDDGRVSSENVQLPNCAVTAGFTLLRQEGTPAPLSEVCSRFSAAAAETASISEVRHVLRSFGLQTSAIRITPKNLRNLNSPVILFFEAGRWPRTGNVGHFVTQIRHDADSVTVLDWSQVSPEQRLPRQAVEDAWTGTAIVLDRHLPHSTQTGIGLLALAITTAMCGWWWQRKRMRIPIAAILAISFSIACTGCTRSVPVPVSNKSPSLICELPMVDLGEVDGTRLLEAKFNLQVTGRTARGRNAGDRSDRTETDCERTSQLRRAQRNDSSGIRRPIHPNSVNSYLRASSIPSERASGFYGAMQVESNRHCENSDSPKIVGIRSSTGN